jgi:hypothetical protein
VTVLEQFREAAIGWYELAFHRPGWQGRFVATREGLLVALGGYFSVVVLAILIQGLYIGAPGILDLIGAVGINALPLLGIVTALYGTRLMLPLKAPILAMLVPAIHAVTLLLIAGFVLSMILGGLATLLLGLLTYLLYRGGKEILGLGFAFALSYAALSVVLLVALPASIYMLMAPAPGGPI